MKLEVNMMQLLQMSVWEISNVGEELSQKKGFSCRWARRRRREVSE